MKHILMLLLFAAMALCAYAAIKTDAPLTTHTGVVEMVKDRPFIRNSEGSWRLLLASRNIMEELGLTLADGDSITVEGIAADGMLFAGTVSKGTETFLLRDFTAPLPGQASTYHVDTKACIGCNLCPGNCPTGAIKMVKGKALIDPALCVECGICIEGNGKFRGCPVRAIKK